MRCFNLNNSNKQIEFSTMIASTFYLQYSGPTRCVPPLESHEYLHIHDIIFWALDFQGRKILFSLWLLKTVIADWFIYFAPPRCVLIYQWNSVPKKLMNQFDCLKLLPRSWISVLWTIRRRNRLRIKHINLFYLRAVNIGHQSIKNQREENASNTPI